MTPEQLEPHIPKIYHLVRCYTRGVEWEDRAHDIILDLLRWRGEEVEHWPAMVSRMLHNRYVLSIRVQKRVATLVELHDSMHPVEVPNHDTHILAQQYLRRVHPQTRQDALSSDMGSIMRTRRCRALKILKAVAAQA